MAIYIAFLVLGGLLLWSLIGAKGWWWIKACLMVVMVFLSYSIYSSLDSYKGWAVGTDLPSQAIFVSGIIHEPDQSSLGAIYIWAIPLKNNAAILDYKPKQGEPRAYKLPYSRKLHEQLSGAKEMQQREPNVPILIQKNPTNKNGTASTAYYKGKFQFKPLREPNLPVKDQP